MAAFTVHGDFGDPKINTSLWSGNDRVKLRENTDKNTHKIWKLSLGPSGPQGVCSHTEGSPQICCLYSEV